MGHERERERINPEGKEKEAVSCVAVNADDTLLLVFQTRVRTFQNRQDKIQNDKEQTNSPCSMNGSFGIFTTRRKQFRQESIAGICKGCRVDTLHFTGSGIVRRCQSFLGRTHDGLQENQQREREKERSVERLKFVVVWLRLFVRLLPKFSDK